MVHDAIAVICGAVGGGGAAGLPAGPLRLRGIRRARRLPQIARSVGPAEDAVRHVGHAGVTVAYCSGAAVLKG